MPKGNILSVEDNQELQMVVTTYLRNDGHYVKEAETVASALHAIKNYQFDVILLDLKLSDGEGLSLIPQFKSQTQAAIIVVSGNSETTEKVVCLEMGADDYMTKPADLREMSARIKAVMRRKEPAADIPIAEEQEEKFDIYDRAIDVQIGRLRHKLNDTDKSNQMIKTMRGVGYMFSPAQSQIAA